MTNFSFGLGFVLFLSSGSVFALEKNVLCPNGQHWVQAHHRRAYTTSAGKKVKATNIKAHCRINPEGFSEWSPKLLNVVPPDWPHKKEKFQDWTEEERERVLEALGVLPRELWSSRMKSIYRANRSKDFPNPASSIPGVVVLYDSAFTSFVPLARILAHELAHQNYLDLSGESKKAYNYMLNWFPVNEEKGLYLSRKDGYVQDDGRGSPDEEYANNLEYYLFEPKTLKNVTPYAYKWFQQYFGDKIKLGKEK